LIAARDLVSRTREKLDPASPAVTRFPARRHLHADGRDRELPAQSRCHQLHSSDQGRGDYTRQNGSRQAIAAFTDVLKMRTQIPALDLATRWLLNIAYMTVGEYPTRCPRSF
jgi:hypothetical protein